LFLWKLLRNGGDGSIRKKKLGQVFLKDANIHRKILRHTSLPPQAIGVEIGCGEGDLSRHLASQCKKLYIIEIDPECIEKTKAVIALGPQISNRFGDRLSDLEHVTFIHADILKDRFQSVMEPTFHIVANIPYYLSAKMMKLLVSVRERIGAATLMVQKEFAKKLTAESGSEEYTSLTLFVRFYFEIQYLFTVSKTCFRPIPSVDSAVIHIIPRDKPLFSVNEDLFFKLIRTGFAKRRKTLLHCLSHSEFHSERLRALPFWTTHPSIRAEALSLEAFYELYRQMGNDLCYTR